MTPQQLFLGIDGGTQGVRVGLFTERGECVSAASRTYSTEFPAAGWAEQDPSTWWEALRAACHEVIDHPSVDGRQIAAVGLDTTACTVVALGAKNQVLCPAIMWMDTRAREQGDRLCAALGRNEPRAWEWGPSKILWLKENRPAVYASASAFLEACDWMTYQLTGAITGSQDTAFSFWLYGREGGGWPTALYRAAGLEETLPRLPQRILRLGEIVGALTDWASAQTGIPAGIAVVRGGSDVMSAAVGLNAITPGRVGAVMGSSTIFSTFRVDPIALPGVKCMKTSLGGLCRLSASQPASGSAVTWFMRQFARSASDPSSELLQAMDAEARLVGPGAGGVLFAIDLQGNRTPHNDPLSRGVIWGLSLHTTRAHVYRAALEGTAYGAAELLGALAAGGVHIKEVFACGGITRSPVWMQIHADVVGRPFHVVREQHTATLGSAILAAGSVHFPSLNRAADQMVQVATNYAPDLGAGAQYDRYLELYRATYPAMRGLHHGLASALRKDE
jgi:sugar (pentulose or hexulose) kinase